MSPKAGQPNAGKPGAKGPEQQAQSRKLITLYYKFVRTRDLKNATEFIYYNPSVENAQAQKAQGQKLIAARHKLDKAARTHDSSPHDS